MDSGTTTVNTPSGDFSYPKRKPSLLKRIAIYAVAIYITYLGALYVMQDSMIFPLSALPEPLKFPTIKTTQKWEYSRTDGSKGVAWFCPIDSASSENPAPTVVYFHGNAEIIDHQPPIVRGYHRLGYSVLLPEYPGYGQSEGKPGQKSIVADARFFVEKLLDAPEVDATRIFYHGQSLGGGVAAQMVGVHEPAGLILESTFTSLASFANQYFAPQWLSRHPFRTEDVIEKLAAPLLIIHGKRDGLITVDHARTLRDLATRTREVTLIEYDCGHNDLPGTDNEDDYWGQIEAFLHRAAKPARP